MNDASGKKQGDRTLLRSCAGRDKSVPTIPHHSRDRPMNQTLHGGLGRHAMCGLLRLHTKQPGGFLFTALLVGDNLVVVRECPADVVETFEQCLFAEMVNIEV